MSSDRLGIRLATVERFELFCHRTALLGCGPMGAGRFVRVHVQVEGAGQLADERVDRVVVEVVLVADVYACDGYLNVEEKTMTFGK